MIGWENNFNGDVMNRNSYFGAASGKCITVHALKIIYFKFWLFWTLISFAGTTV